MDKIKIIAGFLVMILLASPLASGVDSSAIASELRMKQFNEGIDDFFFPIKSFFTFGDDAKIMLMKTRLEDLQDRQRDWLIAKEKFMDQLEAIEEQQRVSLAGVFQDEHNRLVSNLAFAADRVGEMQASVQNADLEFQAKELSKMIKSSSVAMGLNAHFDESGIFINSSAPEFDSFENTTGGKIMEKSKISIDSDGSAKGNLTSEEAKKLVENKVGFDAEAVSTRILDGNTFYVVSGLKEEVIDGVKKTKGFEVWVDAETGQIITSKVRSSTSGNSGSSKATSSANGSGTGNTHIATNTETSTSPDGSSASSKSTSTAIQS